jgi:hypothetical protein
LKGATVLDGTRYRITLDNFALVAKPKQESAVLICVSHDTLDSGDNDALLGMFPYRTSGQHDGDQHVWQVVRAIAERVPVYVVRGLVPRPICDYNRPEDEAFEDPSVRGAYEAYHWAIKEVLEEIVGQGMTPLVIDFHGTSEGQHQITLGTKNRQTVWSRVDSVIGARLNERGYSVFVPAETTLVPGVPDFADGEHTIVYLSALGYESLQVELEREFRNPLDLMPATLLAMTFADIIVWLNRTRRQQALPGPIHMSKRARAIPGPLA